MFRAYFPIIVGIILSIHQSVLAQTDFREGYIVTHTKDTITGFVDSRSETRNARQCEFKKTLSAEPVRYEPKEILGYGFKNNKIYESREVKTNAPNPNADQVFLELLVKGKVSLYHFKEDGRYYVDKDNQGLINLYQTDKLINHNGKPYIIEQKQYIGILNLLMNDCPSMSRKIKLADLEYSQLIKLVTGYNSCTTQDHSVKTQRKFIVARGGVTGSVQISAVRFSATPPEYQYLTGSVFPAYTAPSGGLYLQTTLPWITERISLWSELHYAKTRYQADHEWKAGHEWNPVTDRTIRDDIKLSITCLRLPVLIRYTYPRGKLKPFVQAGTMVDFVLNSSSSTLRETERKSNPILGETASYVYTSIEPPLQMRKIQYYAVAAAGFELKISPLLRWYVECRGTLGNTMAELAPSPHYRARTRIVGIHAGIGF